MTRYSNLLLDGQQLLPGADRNISFAMAPISQAGQLRRTVNGELINVARAVFRKYRISISGSGRRSPGFSDRFPGDDMQVTIPEPVFFSGVDVNRTLIQKVGVLESGGQIRVEPWQNFPKPVVAIGYRVRLDCKIIGLSVSVDERQKNYNWNLELEER